jgi:hypothetical protein
MVNRALKCEIILIESMQEYVELGNLKCEVYCGETSEGQGHEPLSIHVLKHSDQPHAHACLAIVSSHSSSISLH